MNRISRIVVVASLVALMGTFFALRGQQTQSSEAQFYASDPSAGGKNPVNVFSSIESPSWLKNKGLTVAKTHMGQMGGSAFSPTDAEAGKLKTIMQKFLGTLRSDPQQASAILNQQFSVTGAVLYRWNCQGCHGPEGKGFDPEINSIIGPVQGTSEALTKARMAARGVEADDEMVQQVTELAQQALHDRLQHGGTNMPAFSYLRPDEVEALTGYLEKLASVPPTKRDGLVVSESAARTGELILRGTCHICHDGVGPGTGQAALIEGKLPSLASMPRDLSLSGVVHQVQYGSTGSVKITGADVMPAFPYFTEEEIAAAYFAQFSAQAKTQISQK
jgi:mono/diheme cytochrome c family protein